MNTCYLFLAFLGAFLQVQAQPEISYNVVTSGFTAPVDIVNAGDTRLFVVEQGGKVKIWDGTNTIVTPFLDITSVTNFSGEMGLLSLAFHPNYANNRYFFSKQRQATYFFLSCAHQHRTADIHKAFQT